MSIKRDTLFQLFKYTVYGLLAVNVYLFGREEFLAAQLQFANGIGFGDIIEAYAATIDTATWLVLLLMFELETSVLEDRHFTPVVRRALHITRIVAYSLILYALYGYVVNLLFVYDTSIVTGLASTCDAAVNGWSYAVNLDEYVAITAANCGEFSNASAFYRFSDLPAIVDGSGLTDIQRLAWTDAINALTWILVVAVLEFDVRLVEARRFRGGARRFSYALKLVLYSILFAAAVYWGWKGDFLDFWDAFLWLLAFFAIELNVVQWQREESQSA